MNKEFVKKMIKSEMLRCSAMKEILPEPIKNRVDNFEKETADVLKEIILETFEEKPEGKAKECKKVNID
mgnify:CR=1 FL=1